MIMNKSKVKRIGI